jgi:uncharacterized protein (TIRG00374 family)
MNDEATPSEDSGSEDVTSSDGDVTPPPTPDAEAATETPKFGKEQIIAGIITILILILVFAIVLPQLGDYSKAWEAIQNMETWQLGLIIAATVLMILIYATPFNAALKELKYWDAFEVRQTSFMISNVVPAGGAFGLAVQFGMLQSYGIGAARSTAAIGVTSVWNVWITLALPVLGLIGLFIVGQGNTDAVTITLIASAAIIIGIVVFALILRKESTARAIGRWTDGVVVWLYGLFKKTPSFSAEDGIVSFRNSIIGVVADRWALITLANFFQQIAQFSILYLAVVALQGGFDGPINFWEALAAFAFGRLATFIPVPPGGLGTTDAIIASMLTNFGMPNNDALAATMIWRAATYFPQVLIGIIMFLRFRRRQATGEVGSMVPSG